MWWVCAKWVVKICSAALGPEMWIRVQGVTVEQRQRVRSSTRSPPHLTTAATHIPSIPSRLPWLILDQPHFRSISVPFSFAFDVMHKIIGTFWAHLDIWFC